MFKHTPTDATTPRGEHPISLDSHPGLDLAAHVRLTCAIAARDDINRAAPEDARYTIVGAFPDSPYPYHTLPAADARRLGLEELNP